MKKKKLNKKTRIINVIVNALIVLLCIPALIPILTKKFQAILLKPTIWSSSIMVDNPYRSSENFNYPKYIYLNSMEEEFVVASDAIHFEMGFINNYEQEVVFSNMKIQIEQYNIDYPLIEACSQSLNNKYFIKIHNLSNDYIENLKINLTDEDKIFDEISINNIKYIDTLNGNEYQYIEMFEIEKLKSQTTASNIFPILKIVDRNENILEYQLDEIVLSENNNKEMTAIPNMGYIEQFYYDITDDIIQHNDTINFYKFKTFVPSNEGMLSDYYISSKIPCIIKISISFNLNNKSYVEEIGNVVFFNPDENKHYEWQQNLENYK